MRILVPALAAFVALGSVVACTSETSSSPGSCAPGNAASASSSNDGGTPTSAPADAEAACGRWFDALSAREGRCGPGVLPVDVAVDTRADAVADCMAHTQLAGGGATPAFYDGCAKTAAGAACNDDASVIASCWLPKGTSPEGASCSTSDQCASGYCALPDGAEPGENCGVCAKPEMVGSGGDCGRDVKAPLCSPGLVCKVSEQNNLRCETFRKKDATDKPCSEPWSCPEAFHCVAYRCVADAVVQVGETCNLSEVSCAHGSQCVAGKCAPRAAVGEPCGGDIACRDWLTCNEITHRCVRQVDPTCR